MDRIGKKRRETLDRVVCSVDGCSSSAQWFKPERDQRLYDLRRDGWHLVEGEPQRCPAHRPNTAVFIGGCVHLMFRVMPVDEFGRMPSCHYVMHHDASAFWLRGDGDLHSPVSVERSVYRLDGWSHEYNAWRYVPTDTKRPWHLAWCDECQMKMPFNFSAARDDWARQHRETGHEVTTWEEPR